MKYLPVIIAALASGFLGYLVATQRSVKVLSGVRNQHAAEMSKSAEEINALQQKLQAAELERDHFKTASSDIHKLRAEVSELRKANDALNKDAARTAERAAKNAAPEPSQATASPIIPESFPTHWELAQFTATLRSKARQGHLTPEEKEWLQAMKPELEKLESSPETFAEFQTALIQSTVGIADGQKVDQIRNTIQRVYEAANDRGLNLQARPQDDAAWVEQRHQLDRRGTGAIQKMLSEEERAAFDRAFLGVMGVDLGTGVDRSLYPPGFLRDEQVNR